MKRNFMTFATVAALAAGMAIAQTPAPQAESNAPARQGHPFRGQMRQRFMQALNLTDAQKQQAEAIFQQARETSKPVREQLKSNREAMAQAVKSDDQKEIRKLAQTEGSLMGQLIANRAEAKAKFYKLLTPEQRTKADQLHQQFRQRMEQRRAEHPNS
jgi:Spy/CpxP family protein refolding chaperone